MALNIDGLTAAELDDLILAAAARRASLKIPHTDVPDDVVTAIVNPKWIIKSRESNTLLHVLHPGHGWLSFMIPPAERANFLTVLLHQALVLPNTTSPLRPSSGGASVH